MSLNHYRKHLRAGQKRAAGGSVLLLILLSLVISAARADALTMSRMEGSGFTVYFARNPEGEKEKSEVLHVLGSQTAYCMNSNKPFQKGNAVAIDKSAAGWDDAHAKKAALAWYYVNEVSGTSLSKMEREQIIQVMIWNIFKDKVTEHVWTLDPPKDTFISLMEAFESWYASHKDRFSYTASFYANEDDPADSQAVAVFSVRELAGKIHVRKTSSDTALSGGNACYSLAGAVFSVYTDSACTQKARTTGGADASMTTDASGKTGSIELSPGTYYVKETKAPTGFAPAGSAAGVTVSGGEAEQEISVADTPVFDAGGLVIRKIDAETGQSSPAAGADLAGAEFTVRFYAGSYTKDNLPSRADRTWVIRSVKGASGSYEASLSDACRVSGDAFYKSGGKVVLPLGTVAVQETKEPKGYFRSESWKDGSGRAVSGIYLKNVKASAGAAQGAAIDGGNLITSLEQPVPEIGTELMDAAGSHYLSAEEGTVTLTDTVKISHFNQYTGQKVMFTGTLRESDGTVAAQGTAEVTVTAGMSSVEVPVSFDAAEYAGKTLYCDEKAADSSGKTIAVHEGAGDVKQKVYVPVIGTALRDQGTGTKTVSLQSTEENAASDGIRTVTLTDTVTYKNLAPGTRKIMKASLHDAASGEAITDADGKPVEAEQEFTVTSEGTGSVEVTFVFPAPEELAGRDAVAFESVEDGNGRIYAVHADLSDQSQTVYVPEIRTTVRNRENGQRTALAGEGVLAADRVSVSNLAPDTEYRLTAEAVLKSTGSEPETPIEAWTVFRTDGGKITIMEQSVQEEDGNTEDGDDEGEETPSENGSEDSGENSAGEPSEDSSGEQGENSGAETGENSAEEQGEDGTEETPAAENEESADSMEITASGEVQENGRISGYVDVQIPVFDAEGFQGDSLVFFEKLYEVTDGGAEELTAVHEDPEDEEETLHFPDGSTVLTDDKTGRHISLKEEWMDWTDVYSFRNLLPGVRYELHAALRCKETGELMEAEPQTNGFTPDEPDGTVQIAFHVDGAAAAGKAWVAEETLYCGGIPVHVHADPEDEAQTVYVPEVSTVASDAATGSHEGILSEKMVLRDQVICRGLQPECSYEVSGAAMLKEEAGFVRPLLSDGGEPLTASFRFASERASGEEQTVTLDFPAFHAERYDGKTVVIYEKLYLVDGETGEKVLAAVHEEPEDEDQFVRIPVRPPVPEPSVITPAPRAVTPSPVRKLNKKGADSVKTGDESAPEKYLLLLLAAFVTGAAAFILAKVRIYLFKKRR